MKTKSLLMGLMLLFGTIGFISCEKDPAPLTQQEADTEITDANSQVTATTLEISNTEGYKVQSQLLELGLPFEDEYYKKNSFFSKNRYSLEKVKEPAFNFFNSKSEGIDFDFEHFLEIDFTENVGTWTWTNGVWVHTATSNDKIIVKFPYPLNNSTNNATLTYYDYTTKLIYGESVPTGLKCKIEIGTTEVFSFVFTANIPSVTEFSSKLDVKFGKFNVIGEESYNASSTSKIEMTHSFTLKNDGTTIYRESADYTMTPKENQDLHIVINAKLRILSLEFRMKMEFDFSQMFGDVMVNPNDIVSMSLYTSDGAKVGTFTFKYNSSYEDWDLYFVYTNGTEVAAQTVFEEIGYMLDGFWDTIFEQIFYFSK